ncbi:8400_t:CDS:2, partial [Paraglomus occultum]
FDRGNSLAKTREEAEAKFKEIVRAYKILDNQETREKYNQSNYRADFEEEYLMTEEEESWTVIERLDFELEILDKQIAELEDYGRRLKEHKENIDEFRKEIQESQKLKVRDIPKKNLPMKERIGRGFYYWCKNHQNEAFAVDENEITIPGYHVHQGKPEKTIDDNYPSVMLNGVEILGTAGIAYLKTKQSGLPMDYVECPNCHYAHNDVEWFSENIHTKHLCKNCGKNFNNKSIGNPWNTKSGEQITFDKILSWGEEFGQPYLSNAQLVGEVIKHGLKKKIVIMKYKRKKRYKKKLGYRQQYTAIKIVSATRDILQTASES